jgi:hypothetical protein
MLAKFAAACENVIPKLHCILKIKVSNGFEVALKELATRRTF